MMGMMTMVRILPDKDYEDIVARIKAGTPNPPMKMEHDPSHGT